jgi:hypothetical protein
MNMIKKMWWLFAVVAVAMVYWKWSDVKGLIGKKDETGKTPDSDETLEEDN